MLNLTFGLEQMVDVQIIEVQQRSNEMTRRLGLHKLASAMHSTIRRCFFFLCVSSFASRTLVNWSSARISYVLHGAVMRTMIYPLSLMQSTIIIIVVVICVVRKWLVNMVILIFMMQKSHLLPGTLELKTNWFESATNWKWQSTALIRFVTSVVLLYSIIFFLRIVIALAFCLGAAKSFCLPFARRIRIINRSSLYVI